MKGFRLLLISLSAGTTLLYLLIMYGLEVHTSNLVISGMVLFFSSLFIGWIVFRWVLVHDLKGIEQTIMQMNRKSVFDLSKETKYLLRRYQQLDATIREISEGMNEEIIEYKRVADFRKDFIANISHELKTPIFSAQGFVHTLLDGAVEDKSVRSRFLKKAAKSLDGLDLLVQDLLTLSQIEIGDIRMHFEYFDLHKMCEDLVDQLEDVARDKDVDIEIISEKKKLLVFADFKRINQVLVNLVQNAIKYNRDNGWVQIRLKDKKKRVEIKIVDSGEGIDEKHIPRIFERFYRVDKSRTRAKGGTGLGLSIVKHILEGHGAPVKVESIPNKGTSFTFSLSKDKFKE